MVSGLKLLVGLLVFILATQAKATSYCLAVRGNGQQLPAHWGALAQTFETFGVPSGYAGGSSASITGFMLESMLANPIFKKADDERSKALVLSTLTKSLEGVGYIKAKDPRVLGITRAVQSFMKLNAAKGSEDLNQMVQALKAGQDVDPVIIEEAISGLHRLGFTNGPGLKRLKRTYEKYKNNPLAKAQLANELDAVRRSLSLLGEFDAWNDPQLFIRDGIVNFAAVANLFGKLADFYSGTNASEDTLKGFEDLIENCSSVGRTWAEIATKKPACNVQLESLMAGYYKENPISGKTRLSKKVGTELMSLISTGVVKGGSADRLIELRKKYYESFDKSIGDDFQADSKDVKYGYFGKEADLLKVENAFALGGPDSKIDKSERFLGLGEVTWQTALLFSPAEPGLSAFIPFERPTTKEKMLSVGGWSDLHPTLVLKAAGCPAVVYVTRKGGDTIFGMGVAKRLFGFLPDSKENIPDVKWEQLNPSLDSNIVWVNKGEPGDMVSQWSRMFNLANPNSNFAYSLAKADAVVCTDWNAFKISKQFSETIADSYYAPIYFPADGGAGAMLPVTGLRQPKTIDESDNELMPDGTYKYAGCIPL